MAVSVLTLPLRPEDSRDRFAADGYLPLPGVLSAKGLCALREETARLEALAVRRDFRMPCMADSPRHMTTLGGSRIARDSELISGLYHDAALLAFLRAIHGGDVLLVHDPVERHVLNVLHRPGDTHGAHTDDYPFAVVLFIEAPPEPSDGGLLEFRPGQGDLAALGGPGTRQVHHRRGDAYLLRSDVTAHRVTPLTRLGTRRTVLNFAYTTPGRQMPVTDSAQRLYT
jgi:hypothetical protein